MNQAYTKKVLETFKNPHNYGTMKNPDGVGTVGNPTCGDVMKLYIKVDKKEVIKNIKFETFGCVAAIATSSIITDMVKGKTIEQAMKITKDGVVDKLGGLPKIKYHCSVLAVDALHKAVEDYNAKKKTKK
jgi:nitrogen fixation NifU-like protein